MTCVRKRLLRGQVVGNLWILPLTTVLSVIWLFVSINGDFDHQWILGISLESHLYMGALSFLIRIAVLVGFKECAGWTLYIIYTYMRCNVGHPQIQVKDRKSL